MNEPLVVVENVVKTYGSPGDGGTVARVLQGVDFSCSPGGVTALMGSSGSGKTTLLNLIGGLDTPDSGTIDVAGQRLDRLDDDARSDFRLRNIGFIFQFFNLLPNLSVRENITLPALFLKTKEAEANERARELAEEVGLGDKLDRRVHQLSGGEMQRVAIARALVHNPRLLLADEPTGNLDSKTGATILELLQRLASAHDVTILMATHDSAAADAAGRVVQMHDGRLADAVAT